MHHMTLGARCRVRDGHNPLRGLLMTGAGSARLVRTGRHALLVQAYSTEHGSPIRLAAGPSPVPCVPAAGSQARDACCTRSCTR